MILDVLGLVFRSTLIWESSKLICPRNFIYAFLLRNLASIRLMVRQLGANLFDFEIA